MSVPAELMQMLQGGGGPPGAAPGGPGGAPQQEGLPGQTPPGLEREPGTEEEALGEEEPIGLIQEMIDIAQDFLDREDIPEQGKRIMEDVTTKLRQISSAEEKAISGPSTSLLSRAQATV